MTSIADPARTVEPEVNARGTTPLCPDGHGWCEHGETDGPSWHHVAVPVDLAGETQRVLLSLDGRTGETSAHYEIPDGNIRSGFAADVSGPMTFLSTVAQQLGLFNRAIDALDCMKHTITAYEDEGSVDHQWALPTSVGDFAAAEHYIDYSADQGWRIAPYLPVDSLTPEKFEAWEREIKTLRTAFDFLRRFHATGGAL